MKIYPKDPACTFSNLTEARILKTLSHPGIPLIYDLENDEQNYYLIEEYIQGESLDRFLLHQPLISDDFYYMLCRQLCEIFEYLHTLSPSPILYRDLKPEHMILSGLQIKLIDFNIAAFLFTDKKEYSNNFDHLGNAVFSAPENFSESEISLTSDIYSIGKIMEYLASYLEKKPSRNLQNIIHRASNQNPLLRFETAEALKLAIADEQKKTEVSHSLSILAVVGNRKGCGTTHLAISLVSVLNFLGISAVYYEKNKDNCLQNAAEYMRGMNEHDGCYHYRFFHGIPDYGPGILYQPPQSKICVCDYGELNAESLSEIRNDQADRIFFLTTGAFWDLPTALRCWNWIQETNLPCTCISNFCDAVQSRRLSRLLAVSLYCLPFDADPFCITRRKLRFYRRLLRRELSLPTITSFIFHP